MFSKIIKFLLGALIVYLVMVTLNFFSSEEIVWHSDEYIRGLWTFTFAYIVSSWFNSEKKTKNEKI